MFEVFPVPQGEGWLMVARLDSDDHDIAAMFQAAYATEAQEFADRLNIREKARRCPMCGQLADQVEHELGQPSVFVHGRGSASVRHQDLLSQLTVQS